MSKETLFVMREFTQDDWDGYSGAERFEDGSEPTIFYYGPMVIIHDRQGVTVTIWENDTTQETFFLPVAYDRSYGADVCANILQWIRGKTPTQVKNFLGPNLGFTQG